MTVYFNFFANGIVFPCIKVNSKFVMTSLEPKPNAKANVKKSAQYNSDIICNYGGVYACLIML
jgi:hypothetical protein